jgi:Domain of unknown function (DUF4397)
MSKRAGWALIAVAALAGSACSRSNENRATQTTTKEGTSTAPAGKLEAERDQALVRVVNAIPGSTPADVVAGDNKAFSHVDYKTVTPYKELPEERVTLKLMSSDKATSEPLAENSEGLSGGQRYTVIALPGKLGKPAELRVLNDNLTPPSEGKAKVRVVHASPDTGDVDVMVEGKKDPLFNGINVDTAAGYKEVEPMHGTIEVRDESKKMVAKVPNTSFEPGKLYTMFVVGRSAGTPKVEAVTVEDQLIPPPAEATGARPGEPMPPREGRPTGEATPRP